MFFVHDTFFAHESHEFSCKRAQNRTCSSYAERSRKCQEIYTNLRVLFINGDPTVARIFTNSMIAHWVELGVKCLEGTTERSDDNRGRSPRIGNMWPMCLEGTTPEEWYTGHVLWRTAFQAELSRLHLPRTSSPVIKKLRFCSAFQALNALLQPTRNHIIREISGQKILTLSRQKKGVTHVRHSLFF